MPAELATDRRLRGTTLAFARLKAPIAAYLTKAGVMDEIDAHRVFLEAHDALATFRASPARGPIP